VLRWCRDIQIDRIRQLILHERDQQRLSPNGWKEILALLAISGEILKCDDALPVGSEEPMQSESSEDLLNKIKNLDHVDRSLLREASEKVRERIEQELNTEKCDDCNIKKNSPTDE